MIFDDGFRAENIHGLSPTFGNRTAFRKIMPRSFSGLSLTYGKLPPLPFSVGSVYYSRCIYSRSSNDENKAFKTLIIAQLDSAESALREQLITLAKSLDANYFGVFSVVITSAGTSVIVSEKRQTTEPMMLDGDQKCIIVDPEGMVTQHIALSDLKQLSAFIDENYMGGRTD